MLIKALLLMKGQRKKPDMLHDPKYKNESHQHFEAEYEQINENIRSLADIRFKLLALIPPLGGVAVFILSHLGLTAEHRQEGPIYILVLVFMASVFGLLVTLGITLYDQRNSELYNALIHRAKSLEKLFGVPGTPGALKKSEYGGQFLERPSPNRRIIFKAKHDIGLTLIYGPILGSWLFPISYSFLKVAPNYVIEASNYAMIIGVCIAIVATIIFAVILIYLDRKDSKLYNEAAKSDGLS